MKSKFLEFFRMSSYLIDYLKNWYPELEMDSVENFFRTLALPFPEQSTFYQTSDIGALVLLTDYACTVRLTDIKKLPMVPHPRRVKSLFCEVSNVLHMAVHPGLRLHKNVDSYHLMQPVNIRVNDILRAEGLHMIDTDQNNYAFLPCEQDYVVIIDPCAIGRVDEQTKYVRQAVNGEDIQSVVFKELYEAFNCLKANNAGVQPSIARDVWGLCREFKEKGQLVSPWEKHNYVSTTRAAMGYSELINGLG